MHHSLSGSESCGPAGDRLRQNGHDDQIKSTVKTPQGTTTVTDTEKVKQSGDNPPPAER